MNKALVSCWRATVVVLVCLAPFPKGYPPCQAQELSGFAIDEDGQSIREPILIEVREPRSDSLLSSAWTTESGEFVVETGAESRVRLLAFRFGSAATYRADAIIEVEQVAGLRIVLPLPVAAAITDAESSRYHDKNRALAEGMLAMGAIEDTGSSGLNSRFVASRPEAVLQVRSSSFPLSISVLTSQTVARTAEHNADPDSTTSDRAANTVLVTSMSCPPGLACVARIAAGEYRVEIEREAGVRSSIEITVPDGVTTISLD